jgi:ribosomal protein L29
MALEKIIDEIKTMPDESLKTLQKEIKKELASRKTGRPRGRSLEEIYK